MNRKARIFNPDTIKAKICQVVRRDFSRSLHAYDRREGPLEMLCSRQTEELDKKYISFQKKDDSTRDTAFIKFMFTNEHMSQFGKEELALPSDDMIRPQSRYTDRQNILLRARAMMRSILTPFTEDEWFQCCKHGTGSSIGVAYSDTSLEAKFTFPVSITESARIHFNRYLEFDAMLNSALLYHNETCPTGQKYETVSASRATTVPKNTTIDRMIAVEPTGNMFLQQGLMEMMYRRMERYGLDLETLPTLHKERARISSITSREATIDWTSASDCVSIELVRWLLPPIWFECCNNVRSSAISIDGTEITLSMFSTMGNAVTFPLETLVFYCLAQATRLNRDSGSLSSLLSSEDRLACSVFGDDCIVPSHIASEFISVCESVGFICNKEKSFTDDSGFRESCGGDYLRGYDVRPYNLKAPANNRLSSLEPWLYITMNRIIPKYIMCFGSRDWVYSCGVLELMSELFEKYNLRLKLVPPHYPDDSGLRINGDIQRIVRCYPFQLSRVGVDHHGSYDFRFLRFNYRRFRRRVDDLHFYTWLKRPGGGKKSLWWNERRIGGYVVARGKSGHWSLPSLT